MGHLSTSVLNTINHIARAHKIKATVYRLKGLRPSERLSSLLSLLQREGIIESYSWLYRGLEVRLHHSEASKGINISVLSKPSYFLPVEDGKLTGQGLGRLLVVSGSSCWLASGKQSLPRQCIPICYIL